ncbi:MAG: Undecaprenyl diphosphate synthase, partial [uncultured Rubrobacteraceae bacterium]
GRQRALGPAPPAPPGRRPPPGRRRPDAPAGDGGKGRGRDPYPVRVLNRELGAAGVGGEDAHAPLPRDGPKEGAGAERARRPAAIRRPPGGPPRGGARGARRGREAYLRQRQPRRLHRPQLRWPRRDSRRGEAHGRRRRAAGGHRRREVRPLPLRARRARGGPRHPHERRASYLELSTVADRLRRVLRHRDALAGLLAGGVHAGPPLLRLPVPAPRRRL